jgi:hypothetical protein
MSPRIEARGGDDRQNELYSHAMRPCFKSGNGDIGAPFGELNDITAISSRSWSGPIIRAHCLPKIAGLLQQDIMLTEYDHRSDE